VIVEERCSKTTPRARLTVMISPMRTPFVTLISITLAALGAASLVSAPAQAEEPKPAIGDCLQVDDAWSGTSTYTIVDCAETHNSEAYEIAMYPSRLGPPSTLSDDDLWQLSDECSDEAFYAWLGADVWLPMSVWSYFVSVPSDEAWEAGDRDLLCRTLRPTPKYDALDYKGAIPELFASTPRLQWLTCMTKAPKSGADNRTVACNAKSPWLLLGGAPVKGKVTAKYPKDLQAAADKACASSFKRYGKKGTKGVAALLSKRSVGGGRVFTECFIPVKSWNGKVK
jgi:hypothetical protein